MNVIALYSAAVIIWGTTWIAISFQLGDVNPAISLVYRFGLASLMLFGFCVATKRTLKFSLHQHMRLVGIALSMFGFNFYLLYSGQQYLNSAMAAIAFSTLMVMNIVNGRIFLGTKVSSREYIGATLGLLGICTLFWPQLVGLSFNNDSLYGLGLCLLGTFVASLSNMLSMGNQKHNMPIVQTNAWAMGYGAGFMALLAIFKGHSFTLDLPLNYWLATGYLALFGSVIVFGCYLSLLGKIGANKTSYITIITPAIAVVISSIFEDFTWTTYTVGGLVLILAGNVTVLLKNAKPKVAPRVQFTDKAEAL